MIERSYLDKLRITELEADVEELTGTLAIYAAAYRMVCQDDVDMGMHFLARASDLLAVPFPTPKLDYQHDADADDPVFESLIMKPTYDTLVLDPSIPGPLPLVHEEDEDGFERDPEYPTGWVS